MNTRIFYITDSLGSTIAVAGAGTGTSECEADALAKWGTFMSGRPDNTQRQPATDVIDSGLSTELDAETIPGMIL